MRIGIVLSTNEPEMAWNALRFGVTAVKSGHTVKLFLLARGVEVETIRDARFDVAGQLGAFVSAGGRVFACGTCLTQRNMEATEACPASSMKELLAIVAESDKVLTFG
ncbi:MAG: DsrE family protein [Euryarchaeota archaeon]|nr:DsrE family protein [Euryarchaeota archaeon]